MHRPVLVVAPAILPISIEDVKESLRIDAGESDDVIAREIRSAVSHYEGWGGILGICLVEQSWRQDFDGFSECLALPMGPVIEVSSVKWCNSAGEVATIDPSQYSLRTDGGGRSFVRFRSAYDRPTDLQEVAAVRVEYQAGWPNTADAPPKSTVPEDILTAIKFRVQLAYDDVAGAGSTHLERAEEALISKYRRLSI